MQAGYKQFQGRPFRHALVDSCCYKTLFAFTILAMLGGIGLGVLTTNINCSYDDDRTCEDTFVYSTIECEAGGGVMCCGTRQDDNYRSHAACLGYQSCYPKPTRTNTQCKVISILANSLLGLTLLLLIAQVFVCCNIKIRNSKRQAVSELLSGEQPGNRLYARK